MSTDTEPKERRFDRGQFWLSVAVIALWVRIGGWQSWSGWQVLYAGIGVTCTQGAICAVYALVKKRRRRAGVT